RIVAEGGSGSGEAAFVIGVNAAAVPDGLIVVDGRAPDVERTLAEDAAARPIGAIVGDDAVLHAQLAFNVNGAATGKIRRAGALAIAVANGELLQQQFAALCDVEHAMIGGRAIARQGDRIAGGGLNNR